MHDWLVMYVPNGWQHVQTGDFIRPAYGHPVHPPMEADQGTEVSDLEGRKAINEPFDPPETPFLYDNTHLTKSLLRNFLKANQEKLEGVTIKNVAVLAKYDPLQEIFKKEFIQARAVQGREHLSFLEMRSIIQVNGFQIFYI